MALSFLRLVQEIFLQLDICLKKGSNVRLKTQKVTISLITSVISITIITSVVLSIQKSRSRILPNTIAYQINNETFQTKIEPEITKIVKQAHKEKITQRELFSEIAENLSKYDVIDTFSIRLGFDKKLILYANIQKPVLAIHTQNNDIYIIGSAMKVIAKNPNASITQSVPNLYIEDTKNIENNSHEFNFNWLLEQVNLINENYHWNQSNIHKIVWTNAAGFMVKYSPMLTESVIANDFPLVVYLGHTELNEKIDKFKNIASILKQKNFKPREIDLDLLERAFIK